MSEMVIGDDGWVELVGEQTRGGTPASNSLTPVLGISSDQAFEILGELVQKSPAFAQYAAKRAAASRPMTHKIPLQKARDWQIDFGPVSGAASTTTTLTVAPQCLFRGEKVMATDTASTAGMGTSIGQILIGQRLQRPAGTGATLTAFFANNALGNGIKWDTCEKALSISVTVSFISACTFFMTVFGKAVL
jgi:hypothetical protein